MDGHQVRCGSCIIGSCCKPDLGFNFVGFRPSLPHVDCVSLRGSYRWGRVYRQAVYSCSRVDSSSSICNCRCTFKYRDANTSLIPAFEFIWEFPKIRGAEIDS